MRQKTIPEGYQECPDCHGKGECVRSCCSGDIIVGDILICPQCYEHLGEDICELCEGKGIVSIYEEGSNRVDPQMQAEMRCDSQFDR